MNCNRKFTDYVRTCKHCNNHFRSETKTRRVCDMCKLFIKKKQKRGVNK